MILSNQKDLFDIPNDIVYLNCAAQSPCLKESTFAGYRGVERKSHPWEPDRQNVTDEIENSRKLFGRLIGATGDDVAITCSTSYGIAVAAHNLPLTRNQEILVLEGQFPSNYYAWEILSKRNFGRLRVVARPTNFDWTSEVLEAISNSTGIVALPNCHWTDGSIVDLSLIGQRCNELNIPLVIDATQSVGALPTDVAEIYADYLIASAYKWLLCPDTMGFMYVAPKWQTGMPLENNHQSRRNKPSMETSPGYSNEYQIGARRFDMGAADSMIHLPMTEAALKQIQIWGVQEIQDTLHILTDYIAGRAEEMGFKVPPSSNRVGHFIGLWHKNPIPDSLIYDLAGKNIYVSRRDGAIRVSPYLFNDQSDIDQLFDSLAGLL